MVQKRQIPARFRRVAKKGQNESKTQISLEQGSAEHQEYVMDHAGMTEIEQERYKLGEAGLKQTDDYQPDDEWHAKEAAEAAAVLPELDAAHREKQKFHYDHTTERKQHRQLMKDLLVDDAQAVAMEIAQSTDDTDDDKKAAELPRRLPGDLKYDDGVMVDEYVPAVLKKYM